MARLQSTGERADEGTQSEDAFVSKEKVRKAIDAYEDALYKFNNSRDKLWKEKKSIPSDTREREELNSTKQELQDVLLQLNTKELSDLLKQVSVKDTENVIENVLGVVYRQEQRLMAFNALLDKQGHITPEYKEDKKAISVSEFVETDKKRSKIYIMLTGVFHDKGYVVGCDSYLLLARKEDYDKSLEGKVTNKKGEVLDGKYPDWRAAICGKQGKSWGVNLEELHAFTRGVLSKLRAEKAKPSTKKDAKIAFKTADGKIVQCYATVLDKALRGAKSIGAKSFFGKGNGFAITQTPKGYVVCPMLYPHQNIDDNSFAYVPRVSGLHHSTETLSNDTEPTRQPSQAEGTAQAGTAGKGREASEVAKPTTDKQGNPLNADGSLKVEKIGAVEELTDGDFSAPTRNVQLPTIPKNIDDAIGANGKPVVIKKNIFEKNKQSHSDLTPAQSRDILQSALYNADLYGQNQKARRPYNWIVINTKDNTGNNRLVLLEVNDKKDNVEIIHWHYIREAALETIKRQAEREGGLILILPSDYSEEAGGLSSRTPDLSSDVKDSKVLDTKQENLSEDDRANLSELSDFAVNTDSAKRTAVDAAGFDSEALTVPLLVDGKPSRLSVATIVPAVITDRPYQTAVYDYSDDIDDKTNSGWQKWEDLSDEYNSKVSEEEKASVFGDSAELHFKTVDAAVKFDDWLRTGRIEKQQSADELRNDTVAKQLTTNAVLDALGNAGISVEVISDEVASEMLGRNEAKAESNNKEDLGTTDHVQFMRMGGKKKSTLETASPDNQDHQTVVSSADGAKILKILDGEIKKYENVTALSFKMSWLDFPKPYFIGESQCKEI